jgi:hypothetical protein
MNREIRRIRENREHREDREDRGDRFSRSRRSVLLLFAGLTSATWGAAYDSAIPQSKIPPHACPWVETTKVDQQTLGLWKFSVGEDLRVELAEDEADPVERLAEEPELHGGATVTAKAGRFGGGLVLDGSGYAASEAPLGQLLKNEGGVTLDGWLQAAPPRGAETLLLLPAQDGTSLMQCQLTPEAVVLRVDGTERLRVPMRATAGNWHLFALTLSGGPDQTSVELLLDDQTQRAATPAWLKGVAHRLGESIYVGGGPKLPGLHGVVDEVRLSSGTRYIYPWALGWQELRGGRQEAALVPPFFKRATVLTRLPFDGDFTAEPFAGLGQTGTAKPACFQPGLKEQALDLRQSAKAGLAFTGNDLLPERNGTIEFWFRPLDWHNFYVGDYAGADVGFQWLLTYKAPGEADYQASKNLEVSKGRNWAIANQRLPDGRSAVRWTAIHPGVWTHVLITLAADGRQMVYLNGQPQKFHQLGLVLRGAAIKSWQGKTVGDVAKDARRWTFAPSPTLVDELRVFGWAMNVEEAWNAYARWLPDAAAQMKPLPAFKTDFDYFAHSWTMQEKLVIRLACLPVGETKPASADCELRDATGAVLLNVTKQALDAAGAATFTLPRALPFGRYPVIVRSRTADGALLKEEKLEYVREKPVWLGNTLGKERTVPKPWTPMTVAGRKINLIGREVTLGDNGLPAKIETLKQPVLAAQMTVRAGAVELTGQGPTFTETAPDRVAWKATLAGAGLTADLDAWMEFDGLLYCAVTLKPAAGAAVTLDALDVDVPMAPTVATQLLANGGGNDFRNSWLAKAVPAGTGSIWNSLDKPYPSFCRAFEVTNFMPHIWLGTDDVGLYFGAENDQGWTVDGPKPAQEILREGDRVTFRMHILREPTPIPAAGRRFHFVLLPTPAKPEPPNWRREMSAGLVGFMAVDTFSGNDLKTDPTDPADGDCFRLEPRSWEHAAIAARRCRTKDRADGLCFLYADASWPGLGPAFRDWSHNMWADTGKLAWTPEFEDYAVWAINEYLTRGLIDGVYWDDVSVGSTLLLRGGAYEYAGSPKGRRVGFTALAQRRVNLRLWRIFEAAGKEPRIWTHMTVSYEVPLFSFCRYLSNCEFVTGVNYPGRRDAMDMWAPETLRLLGGSAKWGVGYQNLTTLPRTLPVGAGVTQWLYPQQRTETGLYLTSDQMGPADGLGVALTKEQFFDGPVKAYPWWKAAEVVTVTGSPDAKSPLAIVYAGADRAVVIVQNRERVERDVRIELKLNALFPGAQGIRWRDLDPGLTPPKQVMASEQAVRDLDPDAAANEDAALTEAPLTLAEQMQALKLRVDGNAAQLRLRPRDYRVLEARPL